MRPARQLATERYFLLRRDELMPTPAMPRVLSVLREPGFLKLPGDLPGYDAKGAGAVMPLHQAYPSLGDVRG